MPSPLIYEVRPVAGGWLVRIPGDSLSELYADKIEAVARARALMARHPDATVRVVRETGEVEQEFQHQPAR
jgi:hypothetical protein